MLSDYNADLAAITGQTAKIPMLASQQNSVPPDTGSVSMSAMQVWKASIDHPGEIVCTGPKYQYSYATDSAHVHLSAKEYERVGEKTAQVYFERVVMGHDWQPLQPTSGNLNGNVVTVHFHVPVPPLVWDAAARAARMTIAEWAAGRGFEMTAAGVRKMISGVAIVGDDTVRSRRRGPVRAPWSSATPRPPRARRCRLRSPRGGATCVTRIRSSDRSRAVAQPNYCVAFQMTL